MKNIFLLFFLPIIFLFYLKIDSFAQHACNERCSHNGPIDCNEQDGLSYYQGTCNDGRACYSGADNHCRNPYCPNDTDCTCSNFSVSGFKVGMPNNQKDVRSFLSQTVYLDLGLSTEKQANEQPYSFSEIERNRTHYLSVDNVPGSSIGYTLCYDNDDDDCHTSNPTPVPSNNRIYLCSNNINSSVSLWWHYTPLIANAKNIDGPTSVFTRDEVNFKADYENYNAQLTEPLMYVYNNTCLGTSLNKTSSGNDPGTHTFSWIPSETGNYVVYAAANSAQATCLGYDTCVGDPPQYLCSGPNTFLNVNVVNPVPWYKLKNASLNKVGDHSISVVQNVQKFTDSDPDDNTQRLVIISDVNTNGGVIISNGNYNPGPSYNPILANNNNWYVANYSNFNFIYLDNFFQYLSSRKLIKEVSSISEIDSNGVYFIKTYSLTIDAQPPNKNFVLVVRNNANTNYGDVNIAVNSNTFNPALNSIIILAKNINIANTIQNINGIFIANNTFSYNNSEGLKIKGNLISRNAVSLKNRADNTRPSLFVVFSPKMYLDLLPYLSIANYDWQQTQ